MLRRNQTYEKFTKELRCLQLFVCKVSQKGTDK